MEDAHIVHLFERLEVVDGPAALFGVYDGHGGGQVSQFVARHLVEELRRLPEFHRGHFDSAFRSVYITLDKLLRQDSNRAELEWFTKVDYHLHSPESHHQSPYPSPPLSTPPYMTTFPIPVRDSGDRSRSKSTVRLGGRKLYRRVHNPKKLTKKALAGDAETPGAASLDSGEPCSPVGTSNIPTSSSSSPASPAHEQEKEKSVTNKTAAKNSSEARTVKTNLSLKVKPVSDIIAPEDYSPKISFQIKVVSSTEAATLDFPMDLMAADNSVTDVADTAVTPPTSQLSPAVGIGGMIFQGFRNFMSSFIRGPARMNASIASHGPATFAGCTAITVLVTPKQAVIANSGDCRAVLCRGTVAMELSKDHKPTLPEEQARIYSAGGFLELGRVNGCLNLSRALGDLTYKSNPNLPPEKQILSSVPDVIGCDGIWESSTSQEIVNFIRSRINRAAQLSDILEALFEELISPNPTLFEYGCDNMTAILADLRPERRKKQTIGSVSPQEPPSISNMGVTPTSPCSVAPKRAARRSTAAISKKGVSPPPKLPLPFVNSALGDDDVIHTDQEHFWDSNEGSPYFSRVDGMDGERLLLSGTGDDNVPYDRWEDFVASLSSPKTSEKKLTLKQNVGLNDNSASPVTLGCLTTQEATPTHAKTPPSAAVPKEQTNRSISGDVGSREFPKSFSVKSSRESSQFPPSTSIGTS